MQCQPPSVNRQAASTCNSIINAQHPQSGLTPLAVASSAGHRNVVQLLLGSGADCYLHDDKDVSPLMLAARGGYQAVVKVSP